MANNYSLGDTKYFLYTGYPVFEISPTSSMQPKLTEIELIVAPLAVAQVTVLGLGVPAISGTLPTDVRTFIPDDLGPASTFLQLRSDWSNLPTAPLSFYRRTSIHSLANAGGRIRWRFPNGLTILGNASLVVWCITAVAWGNWASANFVVDA